MELLQPFTTELAQYLANLLQDLQLKPWMVLHNIFDRFTLEALQRAVSMFSASGERLMRRLEGFVSEPVPTLVAATLLELNHLVAAVHKISLVTSHEDSTADAVVDIELPTAVDAVQIFLNVLNVPELHISTEPEHVAELLRRYGFSMNVDDAAAMFDVIVQAAPTSKHSGGISMSAPCLTMLLLIRKLLHQVYSV